MRDLGLCVGFIACFSIASMLIAVAFVAPARIAGNIVLEQLEKREGL